MRTVLPRLRRLRPALVPLVLATAATAACSGQDPSSGGGSASCAAVLEVDGRTYLGHGELRRDPPTTGRTVEAVRPGCDDSGGQGGVEPDERVQVAELAGVPLERAVLWNGSVYLRQGRPVPAAATAWFRAPHCGEAGTMTLTGDWLAVSGGGPMRHDGELRPPYRVRVHVTQVVGGPETYVGATVPVAASAATAPRLGAEDVRSSLWQGGQVTARVRCRDGAFEALALAVPDEG